jgi:hypothetical protein
MGLTLGKSFDRNYNIRIPFLNGFYNIGIYFSKKSTFLLFSVDPDFSIETEHKRSIKINMFKNLESSKFCETFLNLHNFRKNNLDIMNQFDNIKPDYYQDISFIFNETLKLSKVEVNGKDIFDLLNIYAFTMNSYIGEFVFIITERHNIVKKLNKKIVRTSGIQLSTTSSLEMLNDFHKESLISGKVGLEQKFETEEIINLSDVDKELKNGR